MAIADKYTKRIVFVTLTDHNGVVLDRFSVTHWQDEEAQDVADEACDGDVEAVGSPASNSGVMDRIYRRIAYPPA